MGVGHGLGVQQPQPAPFDGRVRHAGQREGGQQGRPTSTGASAVPEAASSSMTVKAAAPVRPPLSR